MKFVPKLSLVVALCSMALALPAAQQTVKITPPGDSLPVAGAKINANFTELYSADTTLTSAVAGKQTADSDLTTIAGLSPSANDVLQFKAGAWANRTPSQFKTDLTLAKADVGLGSVENTALSTWAGSTNLTTLGTISAGTWGGTTIAVANGGTGGTTAAGARTNLGLGNVENTALSTWAGSTNLTTLGTISAGTWGGTTIAVANGGTGDTTAAGARTNLGLGNVENTALSTWAGSTNLTTLGTISAGTWGGTDIAFANIAQGSALSVLGVVGNSTADLASIVAGSDDQVFRRSGAAVGFGAVNLSSASAVTGLLSGTNGGTGNAFMAFTGPTTSTKTFTLPNATSTILTTNAAVTVSQGGTGAATLTGLLQGNGTSAVTPIANSSVVGKVLTVTGSSTYSWMPVDVASASISGVLAFANGGTNLSSAADDTTLVSSGTAWVAKALPNCTDSAGNHLNYTTATNTWSCGTTGAATAPAGSGTEVQFRNSGAFGSDTGFAYDSSLNTLTCGDAGQGCAIRNAVSTSGFQVTGGNVTASTGTGGPLTVRGGQGGTTSGDGGVLTVQGGSPAGTGIPGAVNIDQGGSSGTNAAGAAITMTGGQATGTATGGPLTIAGGQGGGTSGAGGAISITGGAGGASAGNGADVTLGGGAPSGAGTRGKVVIAGALSSGGTKFTASGCSNSATVGGAIAGKFASGTTGTCAVTITLPTAPNGWTCHAQDITTPVTFTQTASTTTSCTISATTVSADVVNFMAMGF